MMHSRKVPMNASCQGTASVFPMTCIKPDNRPSCKVLHISSCSALLNPFFSRILDALYEFQCSSQSQVIRKNFAFTNCFTGNIEQAISIFRRCNGPDALFELCIF